MYGIIREENRNYYITKILGYYDDNEQEKYSYGQYFIVLDREKKTLIKIYEFKPESKPYLDLSVLLLDDNTDDWVLNRHNHGCVDFLADTNLLEMVEHNSFAPGIIEKCVEYDTPSSFKEINEVKNEDDAKQLMFITGEFHDAKIEELEQRKDGSLRVFFSGVWGCDVELYFEGDVSYCTDSRDPMDYDPYWGDSQVAFSDGFIIFYDDAYTDVREINNDWCWFKARKMFYKIMPL